MKTRAQSTMEYTFAIAVVAIALFAMSAYIKRGMQGRLKNNADDLSGGSAYSPRATIAHSAVIKNITENSHTYTESDGVGFEKNETSITESSAVMDQAVSKQEAILPFKQEPVR